jgi:hypothetical protein
LIQRGRMYWHPRNKWEVAKWPVLKGEQITHLHLEDIRRYIWLLWFKHTGFVAKDWTDSFSFQFGQGYTHTPGPLGEAIIYHAGQWLLAYRGNYWYNRVDFTRNMCANPGCAPPENIHPRPNEWNTSNSYWALAPDTNLYHHFDLNAGRRVYFYHGGSASNEEMEEKAWYSSFELLPRQTDPKELEVPVQYQDTKRIDWQIKGKVEFERDIITTPDTMGAIYSADDFTFFWNSPHTKFNVMRREPFTGCRMYGDQYTNGARLPQGASFGFTETSYGYSRNGCKKTGSSYQAMVESACQNGGMLPVDETYISNWMAANPQGQAETDADYNFRKPRYASINDTYWSCNSSGFELYLKKRGVHDWYFDIEFPYITPYQGIYRFICDNFQCQADQPDGSGGYRPPTSGDYPLPIGTWRRTWHNTLGRIRPLIRPFEMGTPSMGNYPGRTTIPHIENGPNVQHDDLAGWSDCWLNKGAGVFHPAGTWVTTAPGLDQFFETIEQPARIEQVAKTGRKALVYLHGDFTYKLAKGIKYANVVVMANDVYSTMECFVMKEPVYRDGYTILELDKDVAGYKYCCHDSRVSARHDPIEVEYVLEESTSGESLTWEDIINSDRDILDLLGDYDVTKRYTWIAKPHYLLTAALVNEMRELLHGVTYHQVYPSLSMLFGEFSGQKVGKSADVVGQSWELCHNIIPPVTAWFDNWSNATYELNSDGFYVTTSTGHIFAGGPGGLGAGIILLYDPQFKNYNAQTSVTKMALRATGDPAVFLGASLLVASNSHYETLRNDGLFDVSPTINRTYSLPINGDWLELAAFTSTSIVYQRYTSQWEGAAYEDVVSIFQPPEGYVLQWDFTKVPEWVWQRDLTLAIEPKKSPKDDQKAPWPNPTNFKVEPYAYWVFKPAVPMRDEEGNPLYYEDGRPMMIPEYYELRFRAESVMAEDLEGSNPVYFQFAFEDETFVSQWMTTRIVDDLFKKFTREEIEGTDYRIKCTGSTENPAGTVTRVYCHPPTGYGMQQLRVNDTAKFYGVPQLPGEYLLTAVTDNYVEFDTGKFISAVFDNYYNYIYNALDEPGYDFVNWRLEPFYQVKIKMRTKDNANPIQNVGNWSELKTLSDPTIWPLKVKENWLRGE